MSGADEAPRDISYDAVAEGSEIARQYTLTRAVYEHFLAAFDDRSPLHVDRAYALERGFDDIVAHGAILNGFVSHFVGMHFPGRRALLLSADLRYSNPSFIGDEIALTAKVTQKVDAQRVIVLMVRLVNVTRGTVAATGRVQVGIAES